MITVLGVGWTHPFLLGSNISHRLVVEFQQRFRVALFEAIINPSLHVDIQTRKWWIRVDRPQEYKVAGRTFDRGYPSVAGLKRPIN